MEDLVTWILDHLGISSAITVILLTTFIQITPIKFNPWTAIYNYFSAPSKMEKELKGVKDEITNIKLDADRLIGINQKVESLTDKVEKLNTKINDDTEKRRQDRAEDARREILKFGDEVTRGQHLSQEHYEEILRLIDVYEYYCSTHPNFQNNKCTLTIKGIKLAYTQEFFNLQK